MNKIFDEIETQNYEKRFSKFSMISSIITLGLCWILIISIPKTMKASQGLPEP